MGVVARLRRHKMWGYVASHFSISAVYSPLATGAGLLIGIKAPDALSALGVGDFAQNIGQAAVTAFSSSVIKVIGDLTTNSPVLYQINRQLYESEGGFRPFMDRYLNFTLKARGFELATGAATIFAMLSGGVPFPVAAVSNGTLTSLPNNAFKLVAYDSIVLKGDPLSRIANTLANKSKRVAYAVMSYLPITPI